MLTNAFHIFDPKVTRSMVGSLSLAKHQVGLNREPYDSDYNTRLLSP